MKKMQLNRSVIIGLLARNCKESVLRNKSKLERLGSFFDDYHIVVVENNSTDGTQSVLHDWAKINEKVIIDSFTDHSERRTDSSYARISYMAWLRNRLLDNIRKLPTPDIIVMMDVDIYDFDLDGLVKSISQAPNDWGGLMANGRMMLPDNHYLKAQFDQYAFMADDEDLDDMKIGMFTSRNLYRRGKQVNSELQKCTYYPVHSAFGGIGVYRSEAISNLRYQAVIIDSRYHKAFCEHVPFNLGIIKKGYKNYICLHMVVNNGVINVKPWVAFLLRFFPYVHTVLCDFSKWLHGYE